MKVKSADFNIFDTTAKASMQTKQRRALLGGSFDPVHLGHLVMAQDALEQMQLDAVHFIPAARSPFKEEVALESDEHRVAMLRLALDGRKGFECDLGDIEAGGISYSVETAERFRRRFPQDEIFWIIGADHIGTLLKWHEPERLTSMVTFLCLERPGYNFNASSLPSWVLWRKVSAHTMDFSSTDVRQRIKKQLPVDLFLPASVHNYIRQHSLYL